jgi:hypothetical protein
MVENGHGMVPGFLGETRLNRCGYTPSRSESRGDGCPPLKRSWGEKVVSKTGSQQFGLGNDLSSQPSPERGESSTDNRGGLPVDQRGFGVEKVSGQSIPDQGTARVPVERRQDVVTTSQGTSKVLPPERLSQLGDVGVAHTDNNDAVEYRWALAELDGSQNRRFGNGSCSTVFWWGHGGFDRLRSVGVRGG